MGTKLVELFAYQVVERRNMINDYLRGIVCLESVRGSALFLSFSCPFHDFTAFRAFYWPLRFFFF
jgi:hypothetical protein